MLVSLTQNFLNCLSRAVRAMNESMRTSRRRSDSVMKEPNSGTSGGSSRSAATPSHGAAHSWGMGASETQTTGRGRHDGAQRSEEPVTEVKEQDAHAMLVSFVISAVLEGYKAIRASTFLGISHFWLLKLSGNYVHVLS
jgi:hypothetical protein